jgi:hypothetical protein
MAQTKFSGPVVSTAGFVGSFTGGTTNLALSGTLAVTGTSTLTGAVTATGGVTGALTGNVTGNVTGNINGTVGAVTPAAGSFTTLAASGVAQLTNAANVLVIPTSDPGVLNALWLDGVTIKVSAGV